MASNYSSRWLYSIKGTISTARLAQPVWQRLKDLGINISVRGTKAGAKVQRPIRTLLSNRTAVSHQGISYGSLNVNNLAPCPTLERIKVLVGNRDLATPKSDTLGVVTNTNLIDIKCAADTAKVAETKNIKVCSLNARSVCNKAEDISELITDHDADICAITETWLSAGNRDGITLGNLLPPGYKVEHIPRKGKGGGVALVYRANLSLDIQKGSVYSSFESIEALVSTGNDCVRLVNVYRPPSSSKYGQPPSVFMDEFATFIDSRSTMSGRLLITGDFNFHVEDLHNSDAAQFRNLIYSLNLDQHITEPTHVHGHILDLILTRSTDDIVSDLQVHPPDLSDHAPITLTLPYHQPRAVKKVISYRKLKDIKMDSFMKDLASSQLCTNPPDDLDDLVSLYNDTLQKLLDEHAPVQTKKVPIRQQASWYNEEIALAKKDRRKAERKWRSTKLQIHLDIYKNECHRVKRLCRKAKQDYYQSKVSDCGSDQKKLFRITEELMHAAKEAVLPSHSDPQDLADQFANFFDEKIEKIRQEFTEDPDLSEPVDQPPLLVEFSPITEQELKKIIMSGNSKSCMLDPIPTTLLKASLDTLLPILTKIVNLSITTSSVPSKFKTAVVFPLIKKILLYREDFKNYRPVSNLPYIGKITEKVVVKQMNTHMTINKLHAIFQSAYREGHSTETALLYVYNDLLHAVDSKKCVLLCLLDLSAAFDTINHEVLLHRFEHDMGITGSALEWLRSYFSGRVQFVHVNGSSSQPHALVTGMPQGSVIGPFGFPTYQTPLGKIFEEHDVAYHLYADDTQIYIAFDPPEGPEAVEQLERCISDVSAWMKKNFLKLNHSKTEYLVVGTKNSLQHASNTSTIKIGDISVSSSASARNIGAVFDTHLTMVEHVGSLCRSCYTHIRNIGKIRRFLTTSATEKVVHAFVSSRLDHHNSLLYGLPKYLIGKLQRIQNHAARIVSRTARHEHITPVLKELHWLPVCYRIEYKILLLTFKCVHGTAPLYLSQLIKPYQPSRSLRSADQFLIQKGKPRTKTYGDRAFQNCAPLLWNTLPLSIRSHETVDSFKSAIKTYLFKVAFK